MKLFDIIAPSIALGLGIGRIGCFLNGCCFGKLAPHIPWAVRFPRTIDKTGMIDGSPAFLHHYELGLVHLSDTHALPIHPTQLYSFLADVVLFFLLNAFLSIGKRMGRYSSFLGILYPIIRYSMELLETIRRSSLTFYHSPNHQYFGIHCLDSPFLSSSDGDGQKATQLHSFFQAPNLSAAQSQGCAIPQFAFCKDAPIGAG